MLKPELFLVFIKPLQEIQVEYMVTGSVASIIYGEPRITHDIDLVIDLKPVKIQQFYELYSKEEFYVPPVEVLKVETSRSFRGHFNLIHHQSGFKADIYLKGEDELHEWAFKQRRTEKINNHEMRVAPIEYVIIRKLMYYREGGSQKHLDDIRNMLNHNQENINTYKIHDMVDEYSLNEIWNSFNE